MDVDTDTSPVTHSTTRVLLIGFGVLLGILTLTQYINVDQMQSMSDRVDIIVEEHNVKVELAQTMHDAALERGMLLYSMILADDPFERDETHMQFLAKAGAFMLARQKLRSLNLTALERAALENSSIPARKGATAQNKVIELIHDWDGTYQPDYDKVIALIQTDFIPAQAAVMVATQNIVNLQRQASMQAVGEGKRSHGESMLLLNKLGLGALIIGFLIMLYVVRRIRSTERKLIQATRDAQAANQAKGDFVAMISHEIRTPLTSILGFNEILRREKSPPHMQEMFSTISNAGSSLLSLLNNVLDVSKVDLGKLKLERIEFNLQETLNQCISLFRDEAQKKGIEIELDVDINMPSRIYGDPGRVYQILVNLVGNAIKFTSHGGVYLSVNIVTASSGSERVHFSVTDSGIGMEEDELKILFKPFEQADLSIARKYGGSGLGLTIAVQLAQLMGGGISAESLKDKGTTMHFSMPLERAYAHQTTTSERSSEVKIPALCGRVLLAEDTPEMQLLLKYLISATGLSLVVAEDGQAALNIALSERFDLILVDLHMPVMDGISCTHLLRQVDRDTPIIALSATTKEQTKESFLQAGGTRFLTKPIDQSAFYAVLAEYLEADADEDCIESRVLDIDEELIALLNDQLPQYLSSLCDASTQGDSHLLKEVVHKLKAIGGNYGFPEISLIANQFEKEIDCMGSEAYDQLLLNLIRALNRAIQETNQEKCYA